MSFIQKLVLPIVSSLALLGCQSIPNTTQDYSNAKAQLQGQSMNAELANKVGRRFVETFNHLGEPDFVNRAASMFAEQFYVNDTLAQYNKKADLVKHFQGMNQHVSNAKVTLVSATYQQDSAYVHWHMAYDFKLWGKTKRMDSFGITEMKVNDRDQIIFQQDYWDPNNGFYRHLPYVGVFYSWLLPLKKS